MPRIVAAAAVGLGVGVVVGLRFFRTETADHADVVKSPHEKTQGTTRATVRDERQPGVRETASHQVQRGTVLPSAAPIGGASIEKPEKDSKLEKQKASKRQRYGAFFAARNLAPEQADRLVELLIEKDRLRQDLQDAVREQGLAGDAQGIEELRKKLTDPIQNEMIQILGLDGYLAYRDYEGTSAYRMVYVEPLSSLLKSSNVPLTEEQASQLSRIMSQNDHPVRVAPTDITQKSQVDWPAVVSRAGGILDEQQLTVLKAQIETRWSRPNP